MKEGIGKYVMWYGMVCKVVMSSYMSVGCSLAGGPNFLLFIMNRESES